MGSWACLADLETTYFSPEMFRLRGFSVGDTPPSTEAIGKAFGPRGLGSHQSVVNPQLRSTCR